MKRLVLLLPILILAGCAFVNSTTTRSTDPKTGIATEKTRLTAYSLGDAHNTISKARNQSGYSGPTNNPYAPGTYFQGVAQDSNTTNVQNIVSAAVAGAVQGAVQAAK